MRHPGLLLFGLALFCAAAHGAESTYLYNDSHFHLTNYVQEGTDVKDYVAMMGGDGRGALVMSTTLPPPLRKRSSASTALGCAAMPLCTTPHTSERIAS